MKLFKMLAVAALALGFASCNSEDSDSTYTFNFTMDLEEGSYNTDGYWTGCYDVNATEVPLSTVLTATHSASVTNWGGVDYYSWNGFCPSIDTDNADYSDGNWLDHQWAAVPGALTIATPGYLVGFWDVNESLTDVVANPSCAINLAVAGNPLSIWVANTSYGYYAMKNGTYYNHAFSSTDYFKLYIRGVRNGRVTGTVTVDLANEDGIQDKWVCANLASLGEVDQIYFQMESSDEGQWGMNNPAYFCLENLEIQYNGNPFAN